MHEEQEDVGSFEDLGLDDRLLKAIAKLGWVKPTLIQDKAITLALEGKDVLARARTGSGKTGAYVIPIVQKILKSKQTAKEQCTKAIILAPTKELCSQAQRNIREICISCSREVKSVDVSGQASLDSHKPLLMEKPDIIVGTPSKILAHIKAGNIDLQSSVEMVAVDEADLLFSFGHEKDMKELLQHLPKVYQAILMSATLSDDAKALKAMVLHNPVILKLEQSQLPSSDRLKQFKITCEEDDKFLVIYALLKLHLLHGKMIIFVNSVDRCYKLKLYLDQFSISSCVLNSELPVASRCNIVSKFNEGKYDIIIAADEKFMTAKSSKDGKKKLKDTKDSESGVSRGIDFRNVTTIINFDFPPSIESYIHRVGRTARADSKGMALSFICGKELERLHSVEDFFKETHPDGLANFKFDMEEASSLRYRSDTARRSITKDIIREARRKEIKEEMLNSKKLKAYFEDNPRDLQVLKHDKTLRVVKIQTHLKNVPDYLVPQSLQGCSKYIPGTMNRDNSWNSSKKRSFSSKGQLRHKRKQADPLLSFKIEPKNKKRKIN